MFNISLPRLNDSPIVSVGKRNNPYFAQRPWPPDLSKLDPIEQFRFERKYRRRAKLKWQRPQWVKGVKLTAWGSCLCRSFSKRGQPSLGVFIANLSTTVVLGYTVLYVDIDNQSSPFKGVCSRSHYHITLLWQKVLTGLRFGHGFTGRRVRSGQQASHQHQQIC